MISAKEAYRITVETIRKKNELTQEEKAILAKIHERVLETARNGQSQIVFDDFIPGKVKAKLICKGFKLKDHYLCEDMVSTIIKWGEVPC